MRTLTTCLAIGIMLGVAALPATAQTPATAASKPTDVSAKKKTKKQRAATYGTEQYGPPPGSQWRGPDPSYGPGTPMMREYQRRGVCVIDEGYGRFTFCDRY